MELTSNVLFGYLQVASFYLCFCSYESLKLSDLPVLKRWEIPSHTKHIGRKYKDLDREIKRSTYWELKPAFTANELDWDEDPEKLKLDFNYKNFLEDDEDEAEPIKAAPVEAQIKKKASIEGTSSVKRGVVPKIRKQRLANASISGVHHQKRKMKSKKDKQKRKQKTNQKKHSKRHRSRRSVVDEHDGEEVYDVIMPENFLEDKIEDGDEVSQDVGNSQVATLWDAVRHMQTGDIKRHEIPKINQVKHNDGQLLQHNSMSQQAVKRHSPAIKASGIQYPTPVMFDKEVQSAVENQISKKSKISIAEQHAPNHHQKMSIVTEPNKKKPKSGELGDEQENIKRAALLLKSPKLESKATTRQTIDKPKDQSSVDPSNVARAVAMAMEQLKRDKMWGKVFVHVRPSGQLKVMVQETKKMEDE